MDMQCCNVMYSTALQTNTYKIYKVYMFSTCILHECVIGMGWKNSVLDIFSSRLFVCVGVYVGRLGRRK